MKFFRFYWPAIGWTVVILVLTLIPASDIPGTPFVNIPYFDKMVHAGIFAVFVLLWYYAFFKRRISPGGGKAPSAQPLTLLAKIILVAVILGFAIEIIQKDWKFIHRDFEWYDWLADTLGAFFGGAIANELFHIKPSEDK